MRGGELILIAVDTRGLAISLENKRISWKWFGAAFPRGIAAYVEP